MKSWVQAPVKAISDVRKSIQSRLLLYHIWTSP